MKTYFISPLLATTLFILPTISTAGARIDKLKASYDFLVNDNNNGGGALYTGTAGALNGYALPLSFYDTAAFWGEYVCKLANINCNVTDNFNKNDYTLTPTKGAAGDLQTERVNVHNGTDIYDAATWQIAVVLGQVKNHFTNPTGQKAYALANNENKLLKAGYDGEAPKPKANTNRGVTTGDTFVYNGHTVSDPNQAYYFRMVTRNWLSTDPFMDTPFAKYITAKNLPEDNAEYKKGKISWTDWKPITGENSWAFLVGPLQAAYIHYITGEKQSYVPFNDLAIQNALAILPTFAAMQAFNGGIYYVPSNTLGNQGSTPANQYQISVENNFSLYAGLTILQSTLQAELKNQTDLTVDEKIQIIEAKMAIDAMINGGVVGDNLPTKGLLTFFKEYAWKDGEFIQGGLANDPNQKADWVPNLNPKAVDVNTWGIAALGAKRVDNWKGFGASYKAWQQVKSWGGYGEGTTIWGVGYSNQDGNGRDANGNFKQGVLSAEWTAGAINMVREMMSYYDSIPASSSDYQMAQSYIKDLKKDETSMTTHVQSLRIGEYAGSTLSGKPDNYKPLFSKETYQPYLYASKRYMIPFGWYANPVPSTCSTAWMIMLADDFNPFVYTGTRTY